jgi:hypothetical protein
MTSRRYMSGLTCRCLQAGPANTGWRFGAPPLRSPQTTSFAAQHDRSERLLRPLCCRC